MFRIKIDVLNSFEFICKILFFCDSCSYTNLYDFIQSYSKKFASNNQNKHIM